MSTVTIKGDTVLTDSIINKSITEINDEMCGNIGKRAFINCAALEKADFLEVQRIKEEGFKGCSALNALILRKNSVCTFENNALADTPIANGDGYIYVPTEKVDATKGNCAYPNKVRAIEDYPEVCSRFGKVWQSSNFSSGYTYGATTNGQGVWVAGHADGVVYSEDGKQWTLVVTQANMQVVYANGLWIASSASTSGNPPKYRSTDGKIWEQCTIGTVRNVNALTYGNGVWVAATSGGVFYSADGVAWTQTLDGTMGMVTFDNGVFLTSNKQGYSTTVGMHYSTDAVNWTQTPINSVADAVYVNGLWVIAIDTYYGSYYGLYYSEDNCATWQQGMRCKNATSVYYANGLWVAGAEKQLLYSTDGKKWSSVSIASAQFYDVLYSNDMWLAASDQGVYISKDGKAWVLAAENAQTTSTMRALVSGDGICVFPTIAGLKYTTH